MTAKGATTNQAGDNVLRFDVGGKRERIVQPIEIGDRIVNAIQPKDSFLLRLGEMSAGPGEAQVLVVQMFLEKVFDPEDRAYIESLLDDEELEFDIDPHLNAILDQLMTHWTGRRPTKPSASPGPRRSAGRRSTVRQR